MGAPYIYIYIYEISRLRVKNDGLGPSDITSAF